MNSNPEVTIVCVTYNQKDYIQKTLDSFLAQKTDFPFEILLGEDCSTDGTREIVKSYAEKHPQKIRVLYRNPNLGPAKNFADAMEQAKGKYIALCEGDDFFTDPLKLQMQVDYMNSHPDCGLCFHPVLHFFENKAHGEDSIFPSPGKTDFEFKDLLKTNICGTQSVMYRRKSLAEISKDQLVPQDWYYHIYHANGGPIGFINRTMSAYRRHQQGGWWDAHVNRRNLFQKHGASMLRLHHELWKMFSHNPDLRPVLMQNIRDAVHDIMGSDLESGTSTIRAIYGDWPELTEVIYDNALDKARKLSEIENSFEWKLAAKAKPVLNFLRKIKRGLRKAYRLPFSHIRNMLEQRSG